MDLKATYQSAQAYIKEQKTAALDRKKKLTAGIDAEIAGYENQMKHLDAMIKQLDNPGPGKRTRKAPEKK